jgi:hypothetical protein
MDFILQILFEFFVEFILQIVVEILVEVGLRRLSLSSWADKTVNAALAVLMYLALGFLLGWFSILVFPRAFIHGSKLHGLSLIITPTLAGLTMSGIGWLRARQSSPRIRLDTFAYGFLFAFGMSLVRFLFTT